MTITPRQQQLLRFVVLYRTRTGMSPTMQEIADDMGVTKVTVFEHADAMERRGLITRDKYISRSIEVTRQGKDLIDRTLVREVIKELEVMAEPTRQAVMACRDKLLAALG